MKRNIEALAGREHDCLIIGGGIYGACAAWDAALRGLDVALVERGDFGGETSQNSLKIIHGGLRYLQQADIIRMRESIRERRILSRIAPQFVHPLPCLMPTYGHLTKGKGALRVAMLLNDIISFDRNRLADPEKHLPRGRVIPRRELLRMLPGAPTRGLTGGALWYDCQTHNSERLLLSFILSAVEAGAAAANYLEVTGFLVEGRRVTGIECLDRLTGKRCLIRARVVINAAGPWVNRVLSTLPGGDATVPLKLSSAMNIVTRKFIEGHAVGIQSRPELIDEDALLRRDSHVYFVAPWRDYSIAGTVHAPYNGDPDDYRVTREEIDFLVGEINRAYTSARLTRKDVFAFYGGLLPMAGINRRTGEVNLQKHYSLVDHGKRNGWEGLITIVGVKYTTARDVAAKAVELVIRKLGIPRLPCRSRTTPVYGGEIPRFREFLDSALRSAPPGLGEEVISHLVYHYGSRYAQIVAYLEEDESLLAPLPGQERVTAAEVVHAVRYEMAVHLADVIRRRTELGSAGLPGEESLAACAEMMAGELRWDEERKQREIDDARALYEPAP